MSLSKDDGFDAFIDYVTQGTEDLVDDNRQGLLTDLDYLDDFLGGSDSVGFEIV